MSDPEAAAPVEVDVFDSILSKLADVEVAVDEVREVVYTERRKMKEQTPDGR